MSEDMLQPREFPVSWEEFHRNARALAWRLSELGPFKGIAAVTRGGLVPAAIVAWELDLRLLDTICIFSYEDKKLGDPTVLKEPSVTEGGEGWLIIDDLVDTGSTARIVRGMMPKAHFASVYAKPAGRDSVDSFIMEVSQNTWIIFPWETAQTVA